MVAIAILGNVVAIVLGIRAIRRLRSQNTPLWEIMTFLGLRPLRLKESLAGLLIGGIVFSLIFVVELYSGLLVVGEVGVSWGIVVVAAAEFLAAALLEEVIFRSLFISGIRSTGMGDLMAVVLSGVLFGVVHLPNPHATPLSVLSASLGGVMYGYAFVQTDRIWLSTGLHFAWNFFQGAVYGFPVSGLVMEGIVQQEQTGNPVLTGGAYGPEGGVVGICGRVLVLLMVWMVYRDTKGKQGERTHEGG